MLLNKYIYVLKEREEVEEVTQSDMNWASVSKEYVRYLVQWKLKTRMVDSK